MRLSWSTLGSPVPQNSFCFVLFCQSNVNQLLTLSCSWSSSSPVSLLSPQLAATPPWIMSNAGANLLECFLWSAHKRHRVKRGQLHRWHLLPRGPETAPCTGLQLLAVWGRMVAAASLADPFGNVPCENAFSAASEKLVAEGWSVCGMGRCGALCAMLEVNVFCNHLFIILHLASAVVLQPLAKTWCSLPYIHLITGNRNFVVRDLGWFPSIFSGCN